MKYESEFSIGDKVFIVHPEYVKEKCKYCDGEGELPTKANHDGTNKPYMQKCSNCDGRGYNITLEIKWVITESVIKSVYIHDCHNIPKVDITYLYDVDIKAFDRHHYLFKTIQEAALKRESMKRGV